MYLLSGIVKLAVCVLLLLGTVNVVEAECTHPIYCEGPVLAAVQSSRIFNDSKTFVDMPLRASPQVVLDAFNTISSNATTANIAAFLDKFFYPADSDLKPIVPHDWDAKPPIFKTFNDPKQLELANFINKQWLNLVREFDENFCDGCTSHIPVAYPFVVAGARFREFYYWDTFWAINGLLISDMANTTRGVLRNFYSLVDRFGFVPNGGRIYYLNRSQPPLLIQMVNLYYQYTKDLSALKEAMGYLEKEHDYWMTHHTIEINGDILNRYFVNTSLPRPESWLNDVTTAANLDQAAKEAFYHQAATAAESGWDFSSRWMHNASDLSTLYTSDIVPADLNAILYSNELIMANFHSLLGNTNQSKIFLQAAATRKTAMKKHLLNPISLVYYDYNLLTQSQNSGLYAAAFVPLWAGLYDDELPENVDQFLRTVHPLSKFPGGVPTSLIKNHQQWDYPNGWAPLQYFAVEGLFRIAPRWNKTQMGKQAVHRATTIGNKWLTTNYCAYKRYNTMLEKYDIEQVGWSGSGGEYTVQSGFGWTNGVALRFMELFSKTSGFKVATCPKF